MSRGLVIMDQLVHLSHSRLQWEELEKICLFLRLGLGLLLDQYSMMVFLQLS